jgi:hypothetical protein
VLFLAIARSAVDDWERADADFAEALARSESINSPFFVAVTRCEWAEALARRGDPADRERARALTASALTSARTLGFISVERTCPSIQGAR